MERTRESNRKIMKTYWDAKWPVVAVYGDGSLD
jgi:hypothetical protein